MPRSLMIAFALLLAFKVITASFSGGTFASASEHSEADAVAPRGAGEAEAPKAGPQVGNGYASVRLERSGDGHFYTDALVNGATIHFLVDTGASSVALSKDDAQRAGLAFGAGEFTGTAETAGGSVAIMPVTLDRVAIGPLEARQVQAAVIEQGLGTSLLGQSWLRRVGTVTINGDVMELR